MRVPYGVEKEFFRYSLFLVFCNRITTSMVSAMVLLVWWTPLTGYLSNSSGSAGLLISVFVILCRQVRNPWTLWLRYTNMVLSPYQIYWPQPASMRLDWFLSFISFAICVVLCYFFTEYVNYLLSGPQVCQLPCPNACQMCQDDTCHGNLFSYTVTSDQTVFFVHHYFLAC